MSRLLRPLPWLFPALLLLALLTALLPALVRAQGFPHTFADVVDDVLPTVVIVEVEGDGEASASPFGSFFTPGGGRGSGFFYDTQGRIITNDHVVAIGGDVSVILADGTRHAAQVLGRDADLDLAVLQIDPAGLDIQAVRWADSDAIRVGDWVIAVGNPLNIGVTVTHGIVSALNRDVNPDNPYDQLIQTDAAINSGNSGGPSFDLSGAVMGVNVSILTRDGGNIGIAFMIPSNVTQEAARQLIENGEVRRGFIGVSYRGIPEDLADKLGLSSTDGVFIEELVDGFPAQVAGLAPGDVIVSFGGRAVADADGFAPLVASSLPGTMVEVEVYRDGQTLTRTIELTLREEQEPQVPNRELERDMARAYGIRVQALPLSARLMLDIEDAAGGLILLQMIETSAFAQAGLIPGDVIVSVAGEGVTSAEALFDHLQAAADGTVELVYQREGEQVSATLELR